MHFYYLEKKIISCLIFIWSLLSQVYRSLYLGSYNAYLNPSVWVYHPISDTPHLYVILMPARSPLFTYKSCWHLQQQTLKYLFKYITAGAQIPFHDIRTKQILVSFWSALRVSAELVLLLSYIGRLLKNSWSPWKTRPNCSQHIYYHLLLLQLISQKWVGITS